MTDKKLEALIQKVARKLGSMCENDAYRAACFWEDEARAVVDLVTDEIGVSTASDKERALETAKKMGFENAGDDQDSAVEIIVAALSQVRAEMREALKECADDLEAELNARYPASIREYPCMQRDFECDMMSVNNARALLAK